MKTVGQIYDEYKIMPKLQLHQLRVAAVAYMICDSFDGQLPKEDIVTACLLHDMGNILKCQFDVFPEFWEPEGVEYWEGVQNEYKNKYGTDEHVATMAIATQIGVNESVYDMLNHVGFSEAIRNELDTLFQRKICNYADMRVGPHGVMSMQDRTDEAHKRYKGRLHDIGSDDNFGQYVKALNSIEQQIFSKCKIKPEDINDETVKDRIAVLREFVIK